MSIKSHTQILNIPLNNREPTISRRHNRQTRFHDGKREVKAVNNVVNLAQDNQACSGELLRELRMLR